MDLKRTVFARRFVQQQGRCNPKWRAEEEQYLVPLPMTREGTRKVTEKEVPQVPVRQEGLITLGFKFRKGVMPKAPSSSPLPLHPHLPMRLLARKRLLTPQIQKWLHMEGTHRQSQGT